jgi:hypothetical protein
MPGKNAKAEPDGFSAEERAAMKERAAELRAEGKKGAKEADGLQAVLDRIADDGNLWPVSYALQTWSPVVEKRVIELVKAAIS